MSRIVLTTIGSLGDLHPKIAIALELQKRGHNVVFATHKEYQSKIGVIHIPPLVLSSLFNSCES